jgi:fructokinase
VLSPERIIVGGGVGRRPGLLALVSREMAALMSGYFGLEPHFLAEPALGSRAGVLGAIVLAETAVA